MASRREYLKQLPFQSEFSHRYACWANNHNGWAKMKKLNRRLIKAKARAETQKDVVEGGQEE